MNERDHLTTEERAAYWQRKLAPATLQALSNHLQECAPCREELRRDRPKTEGKESPGYEDLSAWMDGTLDPIERREVAERIANSPQASAALVDLLRFRVKIDELPAHDYSVAERLAPSRLRRLLPLAAGLSVGLAFFWLTTLQHSRRGLALHDSGKQVNVRPNGSVPTLGSLPPDLQNAVREAISLDRVTLPSTVLDLRGAGESLAGRPAPVGQLALLAPVGTLVATSRPTLRWNRLEGANGYRVNLAPQNGGEIISSPVLAAQASEWTPSGPLRPNETYDWEVEALRDGVMATKAPAAPEARFRILDTAVQTRLAALRQKFGGSHLVMGLAFANAGLVTEARCEFEQLARENPESELPKKLLNSLTDTDHIR